MTQKIVLIIAFFGFAVTQAQDSTVTSLDEVVITANKYSKKQSETGKVLTVIGREQLEQNSGKTLAEVLNMVSGTTIVGSNSNLGTNQTVSIRGATAGNVLILVNGIPVNDPSVITNYFDMNFFTVDQIERVEILKGGQSTLYGSDAVAGVINVITRKPSEPGVHTQLALAGGSYGTIRTNLGIQQSFKQSSLSLQYGYLRTDGFSSAYDSTGKGDFDKDGYRQHNLTGSWEVKLSDKLKADITGLYSSYNADVDAGAFRDERDHTITTDNFQGGGGLSYALPDGAIRFNYRYNNVKRLYLNDSVYNAPDYLWDSYKGRTHFIELYGSKKWKHIELLAGIDYRKNLISLESVSVSMWGIYENSLHDSLANMFQISPYASLILKANKVFNLELGGRWNYHSEYGNNFSYTLNPSALINDRVKLFANFYSAFKTPTLYQLFAPSWGNAALKPEESFNLEAGAQWLIAPALSTRAVYFHRRTRGAIEFVYLDPANFISAYDNISRKKTNGVEAELEYRSADWNLTANFTHMRGELQSAYDGTGFPLGKDTAFNNIYRNPNQVFNLSGGVRISKKIYAGTALRVAGKRLEPVYGAAPANLDPYYTVDLHGSYSFSPKVKVFVDLNNLTDQQYFEILGYNTRGFNGMGGVRISL